MRQLAFRTLCLLGFGAWLAAATADAAGVPTRVQVRAISRDAKLIGDGVGGARITIRDAQTGVLLKEGLQTGSSGDTERILQAPRARGAALYDTPGAAGFLATLLLERPTVVEIVAEGPLGIPQAAQKASKTLLLVPGQDVLGDGVVLEIHGFAVEIEQPAAAAQAQAGGELEVRARVRMACGCPTEPGGLWDATRMTIVARLLRDGQVVAEAPLAHAGTPSTYSGRLAVAAPGPAEVEVLAMDPSTANFGRARVAVTVPPVR
jgi:hypothetical protein